MMDQCYLQTENKNEFQERNLCVTFHSLKVQAAGSLKTWQNLYQITWCHISINGLLPETYIFHNGIGSK
jgi:hypothetical protein